MLKSPFKDSPFTPKISYILAALSIYDLEETKGEALWAYDPNSSKDREIIIKNYILDDLLYLSYRHRFILMSMLKDALDSTNFDFAKEFESDYDEHITIAWDETEIADPRGFFADIYRLANEVWRDDLHNASLEDQSTW